MKTFKTPIYVAIFFFSIIISSCVNEEPDIFDASPAERINKAISDYRAVLTSAENGWIMDYYANPASGGYPILVKFNQSGSAILASKNIFLPNQAYLSDSCLYDIIGDNGPVLTFNTYSNILHIFASPDFIDDPDYLGYGLEGDYEFVISKATSDSVWLKGKKHESAILLRKIQQNVSWKTYMNQTYKLDSLLFSYNSPNLKLKINTTTYTLSGGYTHVFEVKKSEAKLYDLPFIMTNEGVKLYEVIEIDGLKLKEFKLNSAKDALVSTDNPQIKLVGINDLSLHFTSQSNKEWKFVSKNTSQNYNQLIQEVKQSAVNIYSADSLDLAIEYSSARESFVLLLTRYKNQEKFPGMIDLRMENTNFDELTIHYKDNSGKVKGDSQGLIYYNEIPELTNLLNSIATSFNLSTTTKLNPQHIKFTKKNEAQSYFDIAFQ
ncbi:hypothetical protein MASR2M117_20010 [Paludibacter sp.]